MSTEPNPVQPTPGAGVRSHPPVVISMGDAAGIGPEIVAKAFRDADNSTKRKLIATLARCIVDMKD
ncbi:MAG: hypothetical protein Q8M78_05270 [Burkholderiaceae bacterium]|nr:hypothetical protein [Burkholderiaceae bacterium]